MRFVLKLLLQLVAICALVLLALWLLGPREEVDLQAEFDPRRFGEGVQVYFESTEAAFDDITQGVEKRVIWQDGFKEQRTPVSILYVHGFSGSSEEIRPVPDLLAQALGANLVYTRLTGHGRGGDAMGQASVNDWMQDMAEALAAARAVGERVVVLSASTGGTLATAAAFDAQMAQGLAALVFIAPNYGINDPAAPLLTFPGGEWWLPYLAGERRSFTPLNAAQGRYWTTDYPIRALLPMAALVRAVGALPVEDLTVPALFRLSMADQVVRPDMTRQIADRWGGPAELQWVDPGPGIDPSAHVIAGDILSPAETQPAVRDILAWLLRQGIDGKAR